jgi:hypothetical protein
MRQIDDQHHLRRLDAFRVQKTDTPCLDHSGNAGGAPSPNRITPPIKKGLIIRDQISPESHEPQGKAGFSSA